TFDECNSQYSEDNSELKSYVRDESDDGSEVGAQSHSQEVMDYMNGIGDALDDHINDKIFIVAKDFGVRPAFLYPTQVAGVVSLGVPHAPFGPRKFHIELPKGFYINRWKEPGRAEADFARPDAKTVVKNVYVLFSRSEIPIASEGQEIMDIVSPSTPLPSWFTDDDLSVYGALYEKSGFLNSLKVSYSKNQPIHKWTDRSRSIYKKNSLCTRVV
nr:putative epoxide hydrolase [Tanacetum cinerariifolium]